MPEDSVGIVLDYGSGGRAGRTAAMRRLRAICHFVAIVVGSLLLFVSGAFAANGRTISSGMFDDYFFAAALSVMDTVVAFPVLVGLGFLIRWIAEKRRRRPLPMRKYMPWAVPSVVGVVALCASFSFSRSPSKLLPEFTGINPPASLSNFQYWWDTLPGDSVYVFSFTIDPADFQKLLVNRSFTENSDPRYITQELLQNFCRNLPGQNVPLPASRLVKLYKHEKDDPSGLSHVVDIFTTADRRQIVICGDN
jgi:hypothetical protein